MSAEYNLTHEALLPHRGYKPDLPLFRRFRQEGIRELLKEYSTHAYPGTSIACGFVCAETYNIVRTADELMQTYCRKFRSRGHGQTTCQASDYLGSAIAVMFNSPVVYQCGGYVFDFTVPLRSKEGKIFGVFINGQARPDPPETTGVRSLCWRHRWTTDVLDAYIEMPVLDSARAQAIVDFLKKDFAHLLQQHNSRSNTPDLDVSAFRRDIEVLDGLFSRAVDRPAWRVYELVEKEPRLRSLLMITPRLGRSGRAAVDGDRQYCSFSLKPDDDLYAHLRGEIAMGLGRDSAHSLYECYDDILKAHGGVSEVSADRGRVTELMESIRKVMVAPAYSRRALDISEWNHAQTKFEELMNGRNEKRWIAGAVPGSDEEALLSVRAEGGRLMEQYYEELRDISARAKEYLSRTELATNLNYAFSEGDKKRRRACLHRAREQMEELLRPESGLEAEWHELMGILSLELAAVKDPAAVTPGYAAPIRNTLAPVLASPAYETGPADYAKCLLACHPFSQPEKADAELFVEAVNRLGTHHLEEDLSEDVNEALDWLESLGE
jgi:ligand-binding sensor protein